MQNPITYPAIAIDIGYHPEGYRIDKSTDPLNRYTRWSVSPAGEWSEPTPVCFHSLPESGWIKVESFAE